MKKAKIYIPFFYKGIVPVVRVIVQDRLTKNIVMTSYTDREGFLETLATGEAVYCHPTRGIRFKKGEASGSAQLVHQVFINRDGYFVVYVVTETRREGASELPRPRCLFPAEASAAEEEPPRLDVETHAVHERIAG